jgi:hypothetical protein
MMEAIVSSETSVLVRAIRRHIPEGRYFNDISYFEIVIYKKFGPFMCVCGLVVRVHGC